MKLLLLLLLTSSAASAKKWTVPVFYWSSKIEAQVAMRKGLEEEIQKYNKTATDKIELVPHVAVEGRQGVINQLTQLDGVFRLKPDALIIQPTDISIPSKALQEANAQNIPVFTFDQFILHGKIASYVASDNYQAGWDNGTYIASLFPKNQELKIVIFEYPIVSAVISRVMDSSMPFAIKIANS
ncbi:MAG: substrate-binding domain-containing protein [Bdellovibrio sp.]